MVAPDATAHSLHMKSKAFVQFEAMLRSSFGKSKVKFLKGQSQFKDALVRARTAFDFPRLWKLAEDLLDERRTLIER
jgi:hypothetical protein